MSRSRLAALAAAWALLFGAAHAFWALGGRLGVPSGTPAISERPWFLAYDVLAGTLFLAAAGMFCVVARASAAGRMPPRAVVRALRVGSGLLAARAAVGLAGDAVLAARGELRTAMLFDGWFLLGAVLFALALPPRRARPPLRRLGSRAPGRRGRSRAWIS